jgi:hypothetical protein
MHDACLFDLFLVFEENFVEISSQLIGALILYYIITPFALTELGDVQCSGT